jgi:hypothetical protein
MAADRALAAEFSSACNGSTHAALSAEFKPRFAELRSQWDEFGKAIVNFPGGDVDEETQTFFDDLFDDALDRLNAK